MGEGLWKRLNVWVVRVKGWDKLVQRMHCRKDWVVRCEEGRHFLFYWVESGCVAMSRRILRCIACSRHVRNVKILRSKNKF